MCLKARASEGRKNAAVPQNAPDEERKEEKKGDRPRKDVRRETAKPKQEKKGVVHASSLEELLKLSKCTGSD